MANINKITDMTNNFDIKKTVDADGTEHVQVVMKEDKPKKPVDKESSK